MEYRLLGRSGLKVSLLSLGTMNFAGEGFFGMVGGLPIKDAARLVDIAVDHGVNLLDTSNAYTTGKSEEAVGQILKGRSDQILVGTKVRFGMGPGPNEKGLSRFHIMHECEASLKRLQRDHIDIYYLHEWHGLTPVEEMRSCPRRLPGRRIASATANCVCKVRHSSSRKRRTRHSRTRPPPPARPAGRTDHRLRGAPPGPRCVRIPATRSLPAAELDRRPSGTGTFESPFPARFAPPSSLSYPNGSRDIESGGPPPACRWVR